MRGHILGGIQKGTTIFTSCQSCNFRSECVPSDNKSSNCDINNNHNLLIVMIEIGIMVMIGIGIIVMIARVIIVLIVIRILVMIVIMVRDFVAI